MPASIEHILESKTISAADLKPFWEIGAVWFDRLSERIKSGKMGGRKLANAIFILRDLVRQPCQNRKQEVFDVALKLVDDSDRRLVEQAIGAVCGLAHLSSESAATQRVSFSYQDVRQKLLAIDPNLINQRERGLIDRFLSERPES